MLNHIIITGIKNQLNTVKISTLYKLKQEFQHSVFHISLADLNILGLLYHFCWKLPQPHVEPIAFTFQLRNQRVFFFNYPIMCPSSPSLPGGHKQQVVLVVAMNTTDILNKISAKRKEHFPPLILIFKFSWAFFKVQKCSKKFH